MAITFEEKSNIGPRVAAIGVIAALLATAVFFGVKLFQSEQVEPEAMPATKVDIRTEVLKDPRIASLELFPQAPAAKIESVRENPFIEAAAATTTNVTANTTAPRK